MAQEQKEGEKKSRTILYIGDDDGYWHTIKKRIEAKHPQTFSFDQIRKNDYSKYHLLFLELLHNKPGFIYLDFSEEQEFRLKLANLLKRENSLRDMPVVGLVDEKEMIEDCIFAGVDVIHVKCGEYHDVVYDPLFLAFPKEATEPQFARAQFEKPAHLISDFRIGYITPYYIHAEGNVEFTEGDIIELETNIPEKLIPSKSYRVKKIDDKNLYYDYRYSYDLEFIYVDEPESEEAAIEEAMQIEDEKKRNLKVKQKKEDHQYKVAEYKSRLEKAKKDSYKWIIEHMEDSKPKKTKILLVDNKLNFLETLDKGLDEYPFTIRTQTELRDNFYEVYHTRPDIIAFQLYDKDAVEKQVEENFNSFTHKDGAPMSDEEIENAKQEDLKRAQEEAESQSLDLLSGLINKIKELEEYKPFLIIFNCGSYNSNTIQDSFKYPFIITHKDELKLKTVAEMAVMFEKRNDKKFDDHINKKIEELKNKDPQKYRNLSKQDFVEKRYFISKANSLSQASYYYPITLKTTTESDCSFYCDKKLVMDTYRLDFPVDMSVTLIPADEKKNEEKEGEGFIYKGLIHSVGENDKKQLRQFVNEIFFSDLNEKREEEHRAFVELNEKERQKRIGEEGEESEEEASDPDSDNGEQSESGDDSSGD